MGILAILLGLIVFLGLLLSGILTTALRISLYVILILVVAFLIMGFSITEIIEFIRNLIFMAL